jgi:hypothetical protein
MRRDLEAHDTYPQPHTLGRKKVPNVRQQVSTIFNAQEAAQESLKDFSTPVNILWLVDSEIVFRDLSIWHRRSARLCQVIYCRYKESTK